MSGRKSELTDKQNAFVESYVKCWNATEAAKAAGYGGNRNTLAQIGFQNLRRPHVKEAIDRIVQENAMSAAETLSRLADQGRGTMEDFVKVDENTGKMVPDLENALKKGKMELVKTITLRDGEIVRFEMYDKQRALELIARSQGAFDDGVTINLPPFDPKAWKKQADERQNNVEDLFDPYEGGEEGEDPHADPEP